MTRHLYANSWSLSGSDVPLGLFLLEFLFLLALSLTEQLNSSVLICFGRQQTQHKAVGSKRHLISAFGFQKSSKGLTTYTNNCCEKAKISSTIPYLTRKRLPRMTEPKKVERKKWEYRCQMFWEGARNKKSQRFFCFQEIGNSGPIWEMIRYTRQMALTCA